MAAGYDRAEWVPLAVGDIAQITGQVGRFRYARVAVVAPTETLRGIYRILQRACDHGQLESGRDGRGLRRRKGLTKRSWRDRDKQHGQKHTTLHDTLLQSRLGRRLAGASRAGPATDWVILLHGTTMVS